MKPLVFLLAACSLVATVEAKQNNNKNSAKAAQAAKAKQKAEQEARDKKRNAVKVVLDAKDTNHDGSLTREEYLVGESDADAGGKRFDQYNKNHDRYLAKDEIEAMLGL